SIEAFRGCVQLALAIFVFKKEKIVKFKELVLANRSYRGYDESRRVTREELLAMVDCARFAASSINQQPLKFCLVCEKDTVDKVQSHT
ncbi:MAG: nitroreductase family protein, partial [Clostridiales bacterium]|nr:nitroreductase family protein [Clostridiales bacterium]